MHFSQWNGSTDLTAKLLNNGADGWALAADFASQCIDQILCQSRTFRGMIQGFHWLSAEKWTGSPVKHEWANIDQGTITGLVRSMQSYIKAPRNSNCIGFHRITKRDEMIHIHQRDSLFISSHFCAFCSLVITQHEVLFWTFVSGTIVCIQSLWPNTEGQKCNGPSNLVNHCKILFPVESVMEYASRFGSRSLTCVLTLRYRLYPPPSKSQLCASLPEAP